MKKVTTNDEQRLFVIPCGEGYSCFGFDNCYNESVALFQQIPNGPKELWPNPNEKGTLKQYDNHGKLVRLAMPHIQNKTWFALNTPAEVRREIENARIGGYKLRIFYGDADTGRDWLQEYEMIGSIGRSTGAMKIPLMIEGRGIGGAGLLDDCIVRIIRCDTRQEVYRHPKYNQPDMKIVPAYAEGYAEAVNCDGAIHAQFKKPGQAQRWIDFMRGDRFTK